MTPITIPRRQTRCAHKDEPLQEGMEIYSVITGEIGSKEMTRYDVCADCWPSFSLPESISAPFRGHWKSTIEKKQPKNDSRKEKAFALLRSLFAHQEAEADEIFVLALFLARAKVIVLRKEFKGEDNAPYALYEAPHTGEAFTIKVCTISPTRIGVLQNILGEKLNAVSY